MTLNGLCQHTNSVKMGAKLQATTAGCVWTYQGVDLEQRPGTQSDLAHADLVKTAITSNLSETGLYITSNGEGDLLDRKSHRKLPR